MTTLDIVIPVYNEEAGIPPLLDRLEALNRLLAGVEIHVTFVDDHSQDRSALLLKEVCGTHLNYSYLRLARNSGSHIAILAGLRHGCADCAVFLAADLQDPPEIIPQLLKSWRQGSQIVWAVREHRDGISSAERWTANLFYKLAVNLGHLPLAPTGSDFALLDRQVIDALLKSVSSNPSLGGEIARLGFSQGEIRYTKERRRFGRSKWSFSRKLQAFADAFVAFSYLPLRAMSYLGILFGFLGLVYALHVIILRLIVETPIEGWSSLMVAVLVLGGVQMTMLGVLGEYLWRTLEAARHRPLYTIEERIGGRS